MLGQVYDDASSMSGNFKGIESIITRKHSTILNDRCNVNFLNLSLIDPLNVNHIHNCIETIISIGNFIQRPAK